MNIKQLVEDAYNQAVKSGFHDNDTKVTFGDRIALIHSEASEALEAFREFADVEEMWELPNEDWTLYKPVGSSCNPKPVGVPSELADIVIRVADLCGTYGIDLEKAINDKMAYNATRPYRHGGKKL